LFYGKGDIVGNYKIVLLQVGNSRQPTALGEELLGFMLGKEGVEKPLEDNSPTNAISHRNSEVSKWCIEPFENMAHNGVFIIDQWYKKDWAASEFGSDEWYIKANLQNQQRQD